MINDIGINNQWQCFDIEPNKINNFSKFKVQQKDVINEFPKNSIICITNPPYLAKNSAIRDKLPFPTNFNYDDLYKISLDIMLQNCDYVAAIIPESFITQKLFQDRLFGLYH